MSVSTKELAAAERARWLFELAQAIDEAQWAAWQLGTGSGGKPEALELYARLEAARAEVEALRGRILVNRLEPPGEEPDPSIGWDLGDTPGGEPQTPSGNSPPPENGSR